MGLVTKYYFLFEGCFFKFAVLSLWGALSDERSGLSGKINVITTDGQAVSLSWCQAPLSDPRPIFWELS
jgi:hypothetical protein